MNDVVIGFTVNFLSNAPDEWLNDFSENLSDITDPENPAHYLRDGRPFLKATIPEEDDIPF
jgi:hypothetical protein